MVGAMTAAPPADRVGEVIADRYVLEARLGRGAMAEVYRALDRASGIHVAIKILRAAMARDPEQSARFEREAQVQGMVRHRNVAAIYGGGLTARGEPFIVVELLRGKSLRTLIKAEGRVPPSRAISYAWQALAGLSAVHACGILHRDLKPANLMLEPSPGPVDRVALIDFGFASLEGEAGLTQQGTVVGSLVYLSPERLAGEAADERSDVYAMGIIFFELLTGRPPFLADGDDEMAIINQHFEAAVPALALHGVAPEVAQVLDPIIRRALAKAPADRYLSARHMSLDLEDAARAVPSSERRHGATLQEY
jgi:serine/threonine protein kinase